MTLTPQDFPGIGDQRDPGPMGACFLIVEDALDRVLCQLRDDFDHISMPARWCFFGGGIEPGEDLTTCMVREFEEETGIALDPATLSPLGRVLSMNQNRSQLFVFRTARRDLTPADIRVGEGAGFAFLTRRQLRQVDFADWLKPARDHFLALP